MFDIVDTSFSYEGEMIVCLFLQDSARKTEVTGKLSSMNILGFYFVGVASVVSISIYNNVYNNSKAFFLLTKQNIFN